MPSSSPASVRAAIAKRTPHPVYPLLGDDDAEISRDDFGWDEALRRLPQVQLHS